MGRDFNVRAGDNTSSRTPRCVMVGPRMTGEEPGPSSWRFQRSLRSLALAAVMYFPCFCQWLPWASPPTLSQSAAETEASSAKSAANVLARVT